MSVSPSKPRRSIHVYQSEFIDVRVKKEADSLIKHGVVSECILVSVPVKGAPEYEDLGGNLVAWRVPLWSKRIYSGRLFRPFHLAEWMIRTILKLRKTDFEFITCNSLMSLPIGVWLKLEKGCFLVYDPQELETETHGMRGIRRIMGRIQERLLIRHVDAFFAVSDSIVDWYKSSYPSLSSKRDRIASIRNIPVTPSLLPEQKSRFRETFKIPSEHVVFVYQGLLSEGRNISAMLETFSKADPSKHIVFMGFGPLESKVKEYAGRYPNIHFHPPVKANEVMSYTRGADIGLCLTDDSCLNHKLTIANKPFECILSGVPVVLSNFPDLSKVVDVHGVGWKIPPNGAALAELVGRIDRADALEKKRNVLEAQKVLNWETEVLPMVRVYSELAGGSAAPTA